MQQPKSATVLTQFFGFALFSVLWFGFGYLGRDPIRPADPLVMTEATTAELTRPHDFYGLLWYWLFSVVYTHMCIQLQVAHIANQPFSPFFFNSVFVMIALTLAFVINAYV